MSTLRAMLCPTPRRTQVLLEEDHHVILKANLAPMTRCHPAALGALLEALALWQTARIFAVLAVDSRAAASSWTDFPVDSIRIELMQCAVDRPRSIDHLRQMLDHLQPSVRRGGGHDR